MAEAPLPPLDWLIDYTPLRSLPLDQEALRIYEYAYRVGLKTEAGGTPPVSFTTLLIALLNGEDETSRWFAKLSADIGPKRADVYKEKDFNKEQFDALVPSPIGPANPPVLSSDKQLLTVSAHTVLQNAEQRALQVGGSDIGVRHLVASYVLNPPPNHRAQMQRWHFQESKWRSEFFPWVAARYTAEQWTEASQRPAPTQAPVSAFELPTISGATLAFPGDENSLAILDRAAQFHSRRTKDEWLRLQTVFYALVETAAQNAAIRTAIKPISEAIDSQPVNGKYESERDAFIPSTPGDAATSFSGVDISPRVLNALETARELAAATWRDDENEFRVGALHLAGALISRRVDGDAELVSLGLDPQKLRLQLIDYAQKNGQLGEAWREALGEEESLPSGRPVDLNSDDPEAVVRLDEEWKNDPLLIRPDVEAFAALLASESLKPPLSIGLFGPWGSGKTTFLRRLQRAVKRRANEARTARTNSQPTPYVGNVVHVDFNAWHFAEDALTSSLVDTIFRELTSYIKQEQPAYGDRWAEQKRNELETAKRTFEAANTVKAAAEKAVTDAETALADARTKAAQLTTKLQTIVEGIWSQTKTSLASTPEVSGVLKTVGDTVKSSGELHAKLNSIRTRPARLFSDLGWGRTILFALLVLVVPPLVAWVVKTITGQTGQEVISAITAMLVVVGGWLRNATQAVSKIDQAIARVAAEYDAQIAANPAVQQAQQNLEAAQVSATTAELGVEAAREALAKAQAEAANATLPAQMLQLVSGRIEDKTYNKELTTLSLARADLQALSTILRDQTKDPKPAEGDPSQPGAAKLAIRPVERVILYIDDLDRCKPADVVRVLQLVHMLLAFELFVVVVAVDARWIEESLLDSYKWLAGTDGAVDSATNGQPRKQQATARVTPQDYLEKIFQISFWLEPMTSGRAARYLGSLVGTQSREFDPITGAPEGATGESNIDIAGVELDYMRALAAYVGPSPRRVKRLVNSYCLIKARLSNAQLATFVTRQTEAGNKKSGPYQLVIGLLVIGTGAPSTSAQILKEISECDPTDSPEALVERFRDRDELDWTMAAKVIETVMRTQKASDVSELRGWARNVGRFLLNSPTGVVTPVRHSTPEAVLQPQPSKIT